jgi:urease accessory protein
MSVDAFPSETTASAAALGAIRARGGVRVRFDAAGGRTRAANVHQSGGFRLPLPDTFARHLEAALVNTGGGIAGGDHVETRIEAAGGSDVVFTTQAAERIYRSQGEACVLEVAIRLDAGARLDWLPQQTILYAGARLTRRIEVDVAGDSRLLLAEMLTFGRAASQESVAPVAISDQWRVRRDGRLVFAEALRVQGGMAEALAPAAMAGGARASAVALLVAPDAEDFVARARGALDGAACEAGVSAWNGLLAARLLALRPADAIRALGRLAEALAGRPMPRVWSI